MKLNNIIGAAAEMLALQDVNTLIENNSSEAELCANHNYTILRRCTNLVLANVASNYLDCLAVQTFEVIDNKIEFDKFDKIFLRVKSVRTGGCEADYSLFIGFIKVPNGRVEVTYAFVPYFTSGEQELAVPNLSEAALVYGVLTEYAFISGMFNEAQVWGERFEYYLFGAKEYKNVVMPAGKW